MARAIDADALDVHSLPMDMGGCLFIDDVTEMIANAPTIEPKQEWIDLQERRPEMEKLGSVWISETILAAHHGYVICFGYFKKTKERIDKIESTGFIDSTNKTEKPEIIEEKVEDIKTKKRRL